jgi:hypothetical protein
VQNGAFIMLSILLTVPEATTCWRRSEHRTLHAINARTASYTLALPALTRAWVKFLDCTTQPDGTRTLDAMPDKDCEPGYTYCGALCALVWGVLVPTKLFCTLRKSAAHGDWSPDEVESHAWLLLKYKPDRWYFVSLFQTVRRASPRVCVSIYAAACP